eukprot:1684529-Prorocentrum_lima.AAC.1
MAEDNLALQPAPLNPSQPVQLPGTVEETSRSSPMFPVTQASQLSPQFEPTWEQNPNNLANRG